MKETITPTAIVTGASSGIGFAIVKALLERGYQVTGNARTAERLQEAAAQLGSPASFHGVAGDIALKETSVRLFEETIARFGKVDLLVNNAGIFLSRVFNDYTEDDLDALIGTNLKGFFHASQAAAAHMIPRRQGRIINITASIGFQPLSAVPMVLPVLIKGGINQATRALAVELAPHNIQVSAVAPGIIDTPLNGAVDHQFLNTLQPAGRLGTTGEVVEAVLYLANAGFTTGVVLAVDGGLSAGK